VACSAWDARRTAGEGGGAPACSRRGSQSHVKMRAALREARVVGLARVSSGNLNPSAVDAVKRDGRLQGTQIAQQQPEHRSINNCSLSCASDADSMADSTSCFNYCAAAKVDRQTPVFSAIVQGLDFYCYYGDLTCCASGDDVRVAHSCTPIGKAPWAQLSATQRIRVRKCLSQKDSGPRAGLCHRKRPARGCFADVAR
jgi:hypothetical protein